MRKHFLAGILGFALALMLCAGSALAAKNSAATKVPTLKIVSLPRRSTIESGRSGDVGISASVPGFMTLWLTDASGATVRTFFTDAEVHSLNNYFNISALDDRGEKLPAGSYQLNATMITQYGTPSKSAATKTLKIKESSEEEDGVSSAILTAESAAAMGLSLGGAGTGTFDGQSFPAGGTGLAAIASDLAYSAGSGISVGAEGYQIGVGVTDRYPDDGSFWSLASGASDEEIWAAIIRPVTSVNVDEKELSYIYDSTEEKRKQIGTVSGLSQGLHLLAARADGWSLVEAYRNEDGAFVRGYIRTNRLKTIEANQTYGIVVDKAAQTLTVYMNGQRVGSCMVSTGLATTRYLARETPAGEFLTVTRRGTIEYYNTDNWSKYTVRINGNYNLMEIPTTRKGGSDYSPMLSLLGMKSTRGSIVIAHDPSLDGSINAEWIWNMTEKNKRVKVLILDDKPRGSVPISQ